MVFSSTFTVILGFEWTYKPGSVPTNVDRNYLSWLYVAIKLLATREKTSGKRGDKLLFTYGVASDRVYICKYVTALPVSSYLAFPSLPSVSLAVYFCCTFPEVTLG